MRLSYDKVFNKYSVTITDKLSRITYAMHKNMRLLSSKIIPFKEYEIYRFDEHKMSNDMSDEMPLGFDFFKNEPVEGYLNLEYIDFYDYLPKEDLSSFKKELRKCVSRNKLSPFSPFHKQQDNKRIDKMGRYFDDMAFSNLLTMKFCRNDYLEKYCYQFTVSLRNLSPSFLVVKYRVYVSKDFDNIINQICTTKYSGYSDVCRQFNVPWYKPKKFGRSMYDGNNVRKQELYKVISRLKWQALSEIKKSFTIHLLNDQMFPPTFETYSTNIRPCKKQTNGGFWNSVMFGHIVDYAPKYNACVCWNYKCGEYEGVRLAAYCGGNYSPEDCLPEIAQHDISNIYAVYVTASTMRSIAERDIAVCNKKISKVIRKSITASVLKVRVKVERKLYYSYRFISEFSGNTIEHDEAKDFHHEFYKMGSISSRCLQEISQSTKKTKDQLDNIFKILNDAAEYRSSESNIKLQWIMMIVTILSLIVTLITVIEGSSNSIQTIFDNVVEWAKNIINFAS